MCITSNFQLIQTMKKTNLSMIQKLIGSGILMAALTFFGTTAQAQSDDLGVRFGIKGGLNISQLYVDRPDVQDENAKLGLHAGVFLKAPLSDFFALQPELLYSNQGAKVNYNGMPLLGIQSGEVRFNLNYIQLPVLAVITAGPISFQAGPYVSYLASANVKDLKSDGSMGSQRTLDKSDFKSFDYGLAGGLAVDVQGFQLGARYNYGLTDIGSSDFAGELTKDSKNSVIQVFVGFGFK
jgi:hypothetical protein